MEEDIILLFDNSLLDFSKYENLKIKWPNKRFSNDGISIYLSHNLIPVDPRVLTVCNGGSQYKWICQINIYVQTNKGELKAARVIDKLRAAFPVAKKLIGRNHTFVIDRPVSRALSMYVDSAWFYIPVQFRVQTIC